jgi:hypothetical protein
VQRDTVPPSVSTVLNAHRLEYDMEAPVITQIIPPQVIVADYASRIATVWIMGTNFSSSAEAQVLGEAWEYPTTRISENLLKFELGIGHDARVLGIVVLNDPDTFSPITSSNMYLLPVEFVDPLSGANDELLQVQSDEEVLF